MRDKLLENLAAWGEQNRRQEASSAESLSRVEERRPRLESSLSVWRAQCESYRTRLEYLEAILGSVPHGILVLNGDNQLEYANQAALEICLRDKKSAETLIIHHESIKKALNQVRAGEKPNVVPLEINQCCFEADFFSLSPPRDGVGLILTEATERAASERQYYEEKRELMMQLAGGIAHEIANQLFPIQGRAQLVSMMLLQSNVSLNPEIFKSFKVIEDQVQRIAHIVDDLRHLSKPAEPRFEALDLTAVLKQAVDVLSSSGGIMKRFRPDDDQGPYRLKVEFCNTPLVVRGDRDQLHQVFTNLIINAAQAMEDLGQGLLTVGTYAQEGTFVAYVEDTGPGIPAAVRQQIFDPYFTAKGKGRGTGLGLTIVKNLVHAHDGELVLRTEVGQGTRFEVLLPPSNSNTASGFSTR